MQFLILISYSNDFISIINLSIIVLFIYPFLQVLLFDYLFKLIAGNLAE